MVTTITVSTETLQRFNALKSETGDGEAIAELSSDQFVNSLLDAWEENDQSIYPERDVQVDTLDYDDVKQACSAAIRDELPVERMGGR